MSGPTEIWKQTADLFGARMGSISDDQWSASTPCEEWDVRALVDHAVGVQTMVAGVLGASIPEGADWASIQSNIESALSDPNVLDGNLPEDSPLGPMPKHQAMGIAIGDLLIHTWDLSRAIGADETLPADGVQAVQMGLGNMPAEFMRAPGRFADEVDVDADVSAQDRLIAFAGRQP